MLLLAKPDEGMSLWRLAGVDWWIYSGFVFRKTMKGLVAQVSYLCILLLRPSIDGA